jgi:endoribonuclease Dicer
MVEAYLGAIFIDSDFNFEVVEEFFRKYILVYFEDMSMYDTFANKHPTVSLLPLFPPSPSFLFSCFG